MPLTKIKYFPAPARFSGELGAPAYFAEVTTTGAYIAYGEPNADTIQQFFVDNGWTVSNVLVDRNGTYANGLPMFTVTIAFITQKKTTAELNRIKNVVIQYLSTWFSGASTGAKFVNVPTQTSRTAATAAASRAATAAQKKTVSEFSFQILSIGSGDLQSKHANFNAAFVAAFPKLLYINPSSSYTNAGFLGIAAFGGQSQLHAVGETALSAGDTKAKIVSLLNDAGFSVSASTPNISFAQKTIGQLESGAKLKAPKNPTDSTGLFDFGLPNVPKGNFLDELALGLGLSTPVVAAGLLIIGIIILKK